MAQFRFKAVTVDGELREGLMEGTDQAAVIAQLQQSGLIPIAADPADQPEKKGILGSLRFRSRAVSDAQVFEFTHDLSTLLKAGMPLDRALEIMGRVRSEAGLVRLIDQVREAVQRGDALSVALSEQGEYFSRFYISMVRASESAGNLSEGLEDLARYLERSRELREKLLSALLYPAILVVVAGLSLLLILTYVVPQFEQLFADLGGAIPAPTRVVIGVAETVRDYGALLALLAIGLVLLFRYQLQQPDNRLRWDRLLLGLPLVGPLIQKVEVARFSRSLGTLVRGGVPLLSALAIARETLTNRVMNDSVDAASVSLKEGKRLAETLLSTGHFPPLAMQMVQVGEETGRLDSMLLKVADIYDRESAMAIQRMLTILEPVLIVGLGVLIAGIILSILVAILSINELPI